MLTWGACSMRCSVSAFDRGHDGVGDGADLHADAAGKVEPARFGGKVEGEQGLELLGVIDLMRDLIWCQAKTRTY